MDQNQPLQMPLGSGNLVFLVTTARGAIPLEGARVSLYNYIEEDMPHRGDIQYSTVSGSDGKTRALRLGAPPKSASLVPGSALPYATYNAEIELEGYFTQYYVAIQVFDGVTSVQTANLVPLPENGRSASESLDGEQFFETLPNELAGGEGEA